MKKVILSVIVISIFGISCQKGDEPVIPPPDQYMNFAAGSTWNYELVDNSIPTTFPFTITSTGGDSSINGKSYHVFSNSSGSGNEYYNITGNEYYNLRSLPAELGGSSVEYLYLKDNLAAGEHWDNAYPVVVSGFPLNVVLTNTITEKGISKTVNGIAYTDVVHVTTTIAVTISGIPLPPGALTTDIHSYYAPKFGLIQSVDKISLNAPGFPPSSTDQQTNLLSATLK